MYGTLTLPSPVKGEGFERSRLLPSLECELITHLAIT
jgi:hypothetical protein